MARAKGRKEKSLLPIEPIFDIVKLSNGSYYIILDKEAVLFCSKVRNTRSFLYPNSRSFTSSRQWVYVIENTSNGEKK